MEKKQLLKLVVEPELKRMGLYTPGWAKFILMIIAHESMQGRYIKQVKGPALGLSQMEPFTHNAIVSYLRERRPEIVHYMHKYHGGFDSEKLIYDLRYMVAMSRLFFVRFPERLPDESATSLAEYAKRRWNTIAGAAEPRDYLEAYLDW